MAGEPRWYDDITRLWTKEFLTLGWALTFAIVPVIAALLGFAGFAGAAGEIENMHFYIFLILLAVSFLVRELQRKNPSSKLESEAEVAGRRTADRDFRRLVPKNVRVAASSLFAGSHVQ
jgi:uncharacterized membrane protein YtjA (UPF0391 family)